MNKRVGFSDAEKKKMTLSDETVTAIRINGTDILLEL